MRFRLTYNGPLLSSNPLAPEKKAEHKHDIRRHFHVQLKELWRTNKFLCELKKPPGACSDIMPPVVMTVWQHDFGTYRHVPEILGKIYGRSGYNFAPLVWKENSLFCSLRILCLRRDSVDALLPRDIDNRVKTLIDALVMPSVAQGSPLKDGKPFPPQEGEEPFFVLLDDDRQITHLEIETDTALEADSCEDESFVRLVISVEIRPYIVSLFNLGFG